MQSRRTRPKTIPESYSKTIGDSFRMASVEADRREARLAALARARTWQVVLFFALAFCVVAWLVLGAEILVVVIAVLGLVWLMHGLILTARRIMSMSDHEPL